jgi:epsilon-lactone hydrolase
VTADASVLGPGCRKRTAQSVISPWLDLTASRASCRAGDAIDYGQTSFLLRHAHDFAGEVPLDDPRVSPLGAELAGLSPFLVVAGGAERLIDEVTELVERAQRAGVAAELFVAPDMPHNPAALADFHPHAEKSLARCGSFIAEMLGG